MMADKPNGEIIRQNLFITPLFGGGGNIFIPHIGSHLKDVMNVKDIIDELDELNFVHSYRESVIN